MKRHGFESLYDGIKVSRGINKRLGVAYEYVGTLLLQASFQRQVLSIGSSHSDLELARNPYTSA